MSATRSRRCRRRWADDPLGPGRRHSVPSLSRPSTPRRGARGVARCRWTGRWAEVARVHCPRGVTTSTERPAWTRRGASPGRRWTMLKTPPAGKGRDAATRGQVLVVFALSLITLLGFAGLAVDGGSTFAQRREPADRRGPRRARRGQRLPRQRQRLAGHHARQAVTAGNGFTNGDRRDDRLDLARHDATASRPGSRSPRPTRTRWPALLGQPSVDGHDDRDGARRLPGHARTARRRSSSRRRHSRTTARRRTRRRPTSAKATATSRTARSTSPGPTTGPAT